MHGNETNCFQWWFHVLSNTLETSWHSFMVMKLISPTLETSWHSFMVMKLISPNS
jgi:hypothetical protein